MMRHAAVSHPVNAPNIGTVMGSTSITTLWMGIYLKLDLGTYKHNSSSFIEVNRKSPELHVSVYGPYRILSISLFVTWSDKRDLSPIYQC